MSIDAQAEAGTDAALSAGVDAPLYAAFTAVCNRTVTDMRCSFLHPRYRPVLLNVMIFDYPQLGRESPSSVRFGRADGDLWGHLYAFVHFALDYRALSGRH